MKFIMIVLTIRFIAELISNKRKRGDYNSQDEMNEVIRHPAEYGLR